MVDPLVHRAFETTPDKKDASSLEDHFAITPQNMLAPVETDHTAGLQAGSWGPVHRRLSNKWLSSKRPCSAISVPAR